MTLYEQLKPKEKAILKLTRTIAWSWWWVLSPLWIPFGIAAIFGIIYLIAAAIVEHRKA